MPPALLHKLRRALRKDPRYLARRAWQELCAESERWLGPRRAAALDLERLARAAGHRDLDALWQALHQRSFAHPMPDGQALEALQPGAAAELLRRAELAHKHQVELLGSGLVTLAADIDWHADLKTGHRWPPTFHRDIEYNNFDRLSDVKLAWELSRLQWTLPLGQAWVLSDDDRHAAKARDLLESWIAVNPYGASVNWACTMEPALRILTWAWLFHACAGAPSWRDPGFRASFLRALYLHGDFVARNLERADVNGNHYTADAAGLVYAGLFFGELGAAPRWAAQGWQILETELPRQVFADGVDFEASVPYHRLVLELFAYPALYRLRLGLPVAGDYRDRLLQMARFTASYSRADGSVPLWGDGDDGRALAFGTQALNDHRYLIGALGLILEDTALTARFAGPRDEVAWLFGPEAAARLRVREQTSDETSAAFREGGFYVLRSGAHHVFVDCGPLGLAGRGGHGHNDLLSLEVTLHGVPLISDCGAFLYTASPHERNHFRATAQHNTPQVDGEEINRFVGPDFLWVLHNDARHELTRWSTDTGQSAFEGRHDGYSRLQQPVHIRRRIALQHDTGRLEVHDSFDGDGDHEVVVPWHFAPGVQILGGGAPLQEQANGDEISVGREAREGILHLRAGGRMFELRWQSDGAWCARIGAARVSPSYGVVVAAQVLRLLRRGHLHGISVTLEVIAAAATPDISGHA